MEKDQIEKLKDIQSYLNYLVGDLMLKRQYAPAQDIMSAIAYIHNITYSYKDLSMGR